MKNYNKILEAVNRGIQLALDDFDDEVQVQNNIKSKQVQNRDYTKEYLDLIRDSVDLGLPSGTLWRKYNLGVDLENLNTAQDYIGNYYAWGELKAKTSYTPKTYKFGKINRLTGEKSSMDMSKYNKSTDWTFKLEDADDVAKQTLKGNWCIPSVSDYEELVNYTEQKFAVRYNGINDLNGVIFIGQNKNSIFIPLSGEWDDVIGERINKSIIDKNYGYFWLSELDYERSYENIACKASVCCAGECINYSERYVGLPIRPVYKNYEKS